MEKKSRGVYPGGGMVSETEVPSWTLDRDMGKSEFHARGL